LQLDDSQPGVPLDSLQLSGSQLSDSQVSSQLSDSQLRLQLNSSQLGSPPSDSTDSRASTHNACAAPRDNMHVASARDTCVVTPDSMPVASAHYACVPSPDSMHVLLPSDAAAPRLGVGSHQTLAPPKGMTPTAPGTTPPLSHEPMSTPRLRRGQLAHDVETSVPRILEEATAHARTSILNAVLEATTATLTHTKSARCSPPPFFI
jgi:hypothetical protein